MTLDELEALDTPTPPTPPRTLSPADIEALDASPPPGAATAPASGGTTMTPDQLRDLMAADPAAPAPTTGDPPVAVPSIPDPDGSLAFSGAGSADPNAPADKAARYDGPGRVGAAIVTGAAKSIYETKDFLFGKPEPADKSALRQSLEGLDKDLGVQSIGYGFVSGLSQFATGMLGAGKLVKAAKLLPVAGAAITGAEATRKGAMLLSTGKAAAVGAVAFDPNGARLSDLVALQGPAWLQNPVTSYLAHTGNEDDTPALGRMKNALESIGVDSAMAVTFALSVKGYAKVQAYRAGRATAEEVQAASEELAQAVAHKDAKLAASKGDTETLAALRETHAEATAQAEASLLPAPGQGAGTEGTTRPDGTAEVTLPELRTETPAAAALDTTTGTTPRPAPLLEVSDEQVSRLMAHGEADTAALMGPGGWEGALERGYKFGDGGRIPWQKFALEAEHAPGNSPLDQVIRRVSDEFAGEIVAGKGGDGATGVRSDALQDRMIAQRVAIYGDDPAELMGALQLAGRNADGMVADVAAADLITLRAATDAANLADRIKLGMLEEYGGDLSVAMTALRGHYQVAATARAQGAAIVANAARTLRRQRADFAYSLEDVAAMGRLSDAKMLSLIEAAGRDPRVADRLLRRGFWSRVQDDASYLYVNNLLWGLRTHFVNFATNSYMLAGRPLERMIGGALQGDRALVAKNAKQYAYMATSLHESWRDAVRTWTTGKSILAPHTAELNAATAGRSTNWVAEGFKPADSVPSILSNAYTGFMKAAGLPTRALGAVDELVKQVVYRSKVQAAAHADGIVQGLEGPALTEHVRRTLDKAFDDGGRAVDLRALEEASIATFQQDLLPGTFGAGVQGFVGSVPGMRFVVPFVRTPTNVLRIGWKLTPGLNLLQGEYRQMLRGEMGAEKQAQAMGQFAMGSLFMGTAAVLTHAGHVTGGGPMNPELRKTLMATGWQPYSFVIPGEDGAPTYVNFGRYDPIAMPFGIIADVVDILERDQDGDGPGEKAVQALGGVFLSLVKQLGQKTYLSSLNDTLSAITSPEKGGLSKAAGGMAASFVPFASGLRFVNPDPHMRETRSIVDKIMATVPGLSETLPAKRDVFGDPMTVHKGLWVHGKDGLVDAEVRRMVDEAGVGPFGAPSSTYRGVDLRDVTTKDGRNAFEVYQELAGHPPKGPSLKEMMGRLIATTAYQKAPDRDPEVDNQKGTKQAMLTGTMHKYRDAAGKRLMADPKVREAVFRQTMKGRAAYAAVKGPKTDQQAGAGTIAGIGRAFGVDLSGMVPEQ